MLPKVPNGFTPVAKVDCDPKYRNAIIHCRPSKLKLIDEDTIVHELVHVVLSELNERTRLAGKWDDRYDYHNEQTTEHITRSLLYCYGKH